MIENPDRIRRVSRIGALCAEGFNRFVTSPLVPDAAGGSDESATGIPDDGKAFFAPRLISSCKT
jgi:hypothetical protein